MLDHRAEAERILAAVGAEKDTHWAQVMATRALVHATLAASEPLPAALSPEPVNQAERALALKAAGYNVDMSQVYGDFSGADELPQVIAWQGSAVKHPVGQLAKSEPFTLRDMRALKEHLDEE